MTSAERRSAPASPRHLDEWSPFVKRAGVRVEDAASGEARAVLHLEPGSLHGTGQVHPGAIFTLAETTATAVGMAAFDPAKVSLATKSVEIRFRRPARGDLWAQVTLSDEVFLEALERLASEGRADVEMAAAVSDQAGERIAEATVTLSLGRL